MAHEIFLITPQDTATEELGRQLETLLEMVPVAAVLVSRGDRDDERYTAHVRSILPLVQTAGAAAILDNVPELVRTLDADGVHMSAGLKALKAAVDQLKPDFIVGTGDLGSRHEAMLRGELDIDYLMFGDRSDTDGLEMANWWAQTFHVPAVFRLGDGIPAQDRPPTEFIAPGPTVWTDPKTIGAFAESAA